MSEPSNQSGPDLSFSWSAKGESLKEWEIACEEAWQKSGISPENGGAMIFKTAWVLALAYSNGVNLAQ